VGRRRREGAKNEEGGFPQFLNTIAIYQRLVVEAIWRKVAGIVGRSFEIRLVERGAFPTILVQALKGIRDQHQKVTLRAPSHPTHMANTKTLANGLVGQHISSGGKRLRLLIRERKSELLELPFNGRFSVGKILRSERLLARQVTVGGAGDCF
jgi:hypothetical protein